MAAEKKQITRNRVSLSCQTCRRRKVKCGKERPICVTCQKAGEECLYADSGQGNDMRMPDSNAVSRKRQEPHTGFDQQSSYEFGTSLHVMRVLEQKLNQLSTLVQDMSRLTPVSNSNSPKEGQSRGDAQLFDVLGKQSFDVVETETTRLGSLRKDHFLDASLLQVLTKLDDLNTTLKSNVKQQMQSSTPLSSLGLDHAEEAQPRKLPTTARQLPGKTTISPGIRAEEIMAPSDEEANVLLRSWLWSIYPIFPLVSPYLVLVRYQEFRQWYYNDLDKGIPMPEPSFVPFMSVMWLTGHISLPESSRRKWFPWIEHGTTWYRTMCDRIEEYFSATQTDAHRSVWVLAASVMYSHLKSVGQDLRRTNVQTLLDIRSAQALGLHSERMITNAELSEAESRRRIWWEISYADVSLSLNSGMPTLIEDCYTDTKEVSELKDSWLGTTDARRYEEHLREDDARPDPVDDANSSETSSLISVFYLVSKARGIATQTLREILKVNMSARPMSVAELKELRKSMMTTRKHVEEMISRIPTRGAPEFDFAPVTHDRSTEIELSDSMSWPVTKEEIGDFLREDDTSGSSLTVYPRMVLSSFHKWARIMLSTILDGLDCASYAPFLRNSKSRLWGVSRNCALRVSHSFLRKYTSLAEAADLQRFRWTWPLLFNPMHAAIIILVDLHERPHSDEAPRSRALIDKVFSFASFEKGIIDFKDWPKTALPFREGGDEAWIMLRKLRHKAWHKAGLDPDVLWSEEQQMQVGVGKPLSENELFIRSLREDIIMSHKKRSDRLSTNETMGPSLQRLLGDKIRQVAAKQYLHPSQVGPGERVTGSVSYNMVDWDGADLPQVLLLRAQQDQEMMPFPPTLQVSTTSADDQSRAMFDLPQRSESKSDSDILHLGDLIKKIKQTQIDRASGGTQNRDTSAGSTKTVMTEDSLGEKICTFRTQQKAIDAAFEDLTERHLTAGALNGKTTASEISLEEISFPTQTVRTIETPQFAYSPFASVSSATIEQSIPVAIEHNRYRPANSNTATVNTCDTSCLTPGLESTQRYFVSFANNDIHVSNTIQQNLPSSSLYLPQSSATSRKALANDLANTDDISFMDFDFDWARWDEMFGTTQGFEDIMMDLASEEQEAGTWHNNESASQ